MRFVFVMDPLDRVTHDKDTTFAFIQAAQARGHVSYHCLPRSLSIQNGEAYARCQRLEILEGPPWIVMKPEPAPSGCASPTPRRSSSAPIRPSIAPISTRPSCSSAPAAGRS